MTSSIDAAYIASCFPNNPTKWRELLDQTQGELAQLQTQLVDGPSQHAAEWGIQIDEDRLRETLQRKFAEKTELEAELVALLKERG